jgi:hypothetical protein
MDAYAPPRPNPSVIPTTAVAPAAMMIFPLILTPFSPEDDLGPSMHVRHASVNAVE